ncbi:MAG: aminoglycoside phosphotransferase family protein [Nitrospirae bacterium]|nr:MAG: aminoglycoside phosphotransferase family protein [Nitrospirota bacterium]
MIDRDSLKRCLEMRYGELKIVEFERLGAGVHGTGFSLIVETGDGRKEFVLKDLMPEGLGHDYPSDRASVFLLALDEYANLPKHVRALDVLSLMPDGSLKSIGGGREYFLLMEKAEGVNYFTDLEEMRKRDALTDGDRWKIEKMVNYLVEIHSLKKESRHLYWRKIRDTIGHGECLMGVFDTYPDGHVEYEEMAEVEKLAVDWRPRLKRKTHRLCQIHGDFHPGNIWFRGDDFVLLDRSRGPWGDAADDVTALTINYIFYSIMYHNEVKGAYSEALNLFYDMYIEQTGDEEMLSVVQVFYAFRGAVVAHPVFYPQLKADQRRSVIKMVKNILKKETFNPREINNLLE